jgi:hypothetical protein
VAELRVTTNGAQVGAVTVMARYLPFRTGELGAPVLKEVRKYRDIGNCSYLRVRSSAGLVMNYLFTTCPLWTIEVIFNNLSLDISLGGYVHVMNYVRISCIDR